MHPRVRTCSRVCTINAAKDASPRNGFLIAPCRKACTGKESTRSRERARCFLELNPADGDMHRDSESETLHEVRKARKREEKQVRAGKEA